MRKGLLFLCALFLAMQYSLSASAAEAPGSIELTLPGGNLYLYPVGEIKATDEGMTYVPTEEFAGWNGTLTDLSSPSLAQDLAAYALDNGASGLEGVPSKDGTILFSDLKAGLYLLLQTEAAPGYEKMAPFLVSLPTYENGSYRYEINANPKFQLTPLPTQPLPSLPQTGQINWPIPVLGGAGILLVLAGLVLQRRRHG